MIKLTHSLNGEGGYHMWLFLFLVIISLGFVVLYENEVEGEKPIVSVIALLLVSSASLGIIMSFHW